MIKRNEIINPMSCLNRAEGDEPLFVLRAKDPIAADIVRAWAALAYEERMHEEDKVKAALELADAMTEWREKRQARTLASSEHRRTR